jgi:IS30 family transposase
MDTVIGTRGGKGGKCFLTLLFRKYNFMLIYLLPYKQSKYVTTVFNIIKRRLGDDEFKRLFEVILTDNGTEFSDPDSIEFNFNTGEKLVNLFYCDPNCSWQKGSIEKNHEFIRYILPKGTSFAGLSQNDCYIMASHINSIPRLSLNNHSPYEEAFNFIGKSNIDKFHIKKIDYDDIDLTIRLLKK